MIVRITKNGIFGKDGEVKVGTKVKVPYMPKGWADRCEIVDNSEHTKPGTSTMKSEGEDKDKDALIAQARELGITVTKQWGVKRLREVIADKLAGTEE